MTSAPPIPFYVIKEKEQVKISIEKQLELYCPGHFYQRKGEFSVAVPGLPDRILNKSEALFEYGVRLEHEYLLVFTSNLKLVGHILTIRVTEYSQKEPTYSITRLIKIEYKDGTCRLTQDQIDFTPSRVIELRSTVAGKTVTLSIDDMFNYAPHALQTQSHGLLCGETKYEWYDPGS